MTGNDLEITPFVRIALSELDFSFARSSGPGGQNVNKVNSKALLRWNVRTSESISEEVRQRLFSKLKLTAEGELLLASDEYRDQPRNREACLEKFRALLAQALTIPKKRKKTKMSRSRVLKNQASKKRHSEKKKLRKMRF